MRTRSAHLVGGARICVFTSQDLEAAGCRRVRGPGRPGLVLLRAFAFSVSAGCGFPARLDTDNRALGCICQLVDHIFSESSAAYGSNQYAGIVAWVCEFSVDWTVGHDLERFVGIHELDGGVEHRIRGKRRSKLSEKENHRDVRNAGGGGVRGFEFWFVEPGSRGR